MRREARQWTPSVHRLLQFLAEHGFDASPRPLAIDGETELVEYIDGQVGNYPLSENVKSSAALVSAAQVLRRLHDTARDFERRDDDLWMFPPRDGADTICHGDFAPYNCVFDSERVIGIIDFDTAHPAPRVWDIAYALYRFAPFTGDENH